MVPSGSDLLEFDAHETGIPRSIEGIFLYEVIGGHKQATYFGRRELEGGLPFVSSGHVAGAVLISASPNTTATLADQPLERQIDTTRLAQIMADHGPAADEGLAAGRHYYAYFPSIVGDAVCAENLFQLAIHEGRHRYALPIQQAGYQCFPRASDDPDDRPVFRHLGTPPERLAATDDFEERMAVVRDGIRRVEQAFGLKLVDFINIVPYAGPDNALTLKGRSQLWFYDHTFRSHPPNELRAMAQHETLHILVDRLGFTRNTKIREWYADLKGYGLLSLERLRLVTTGAIAVEPVHLDPAESLFLAFINEKNFIPGMRGGHAADNLDEFCTSFLHSLLHIDHLARNSHRPRLLMADGANVALTIADRRRLMADYQHTLTLFMEATAPSLATAAAGLPAVLDDCAAVTANAIATLF